MFNDLSGLFGRDSSYDDLEGDDHTIILEICITGIKVIVMRKILLVVLLAHQEKSDLWIAIYKG